MSLNYDFSKVKNKDRVCLIDATDDDGSPCKNLHHATKALIWITMGIGIGKITEQNWKQFYVRCRIYEKIHGSFRSNKEGPVFFTEDEVRSHIGLSTNVCEQTISKWSKRMIENAVREELYLLNRSEEKTEKAA